MKYFSEYLIQKGNLAAKDVAEAFLDQLSQLPPLAKVIYDLKLLTAEEVLLALTTQHDEQIDFISACKKRGLWSESKNELMQKAYNELRVPFGQFLIQKGIIDVKNLVKSLDEFLSKVEPPNKAGVSSVQNTTSGLKKDEPSIHRNQTELTPAVSEINFNFQVSEIAQASVKEIADFCDDSKMSEFQNLILLVKQNITVKEISLEFLNDILKNLQTLKGLAKFSKSEMITFICDHSITVLTSYLRSDKFTDEKVGINLCNHLQTGFELINEVKVQLQISPNESKMMQNQLFKAKLEQWVRNEKDLSHLLKGAA